MWSWSCVVSTGVGLPLRRPLGLRLFRLRLRRRREVQQPLDKGSHALDSFLVAILDVLELRRQVGR